MRCVALLSGGLDSQLAVRVVQQQGVDVHAIHFRSPFCGGPDRSGAVAAQLGVPLTVVELADEYLSVVRQPRFGYGRGANPCVDCRVHMCTRARAYMEQIEAAFVISGEVVGQRTGSQKRRDLDTVSHHSGLGDRLLRPLSAKVLVPTMPERQGWLDRQRLYGFYGRGRRGLIELARSLGIEDTPTPSTGCVLTEPPFARKVFDLVRHQPDAGRWDFELLKFGRHFRFDNRCKVVLGRRETENTQLAELHQLSPAGDTALLAPEGFAGPSALVVGVVTDESLRFACRLIQRFAKRASVTGRVCVRRRTGIVYLDPAPVDDETAALRSVAEA